MTDRRQKVKKPRTTKTRLFFQTETKGKMCACVEPGVSFRFVGELTVTLRDKVWSSGCQMMHTSSRKFRINSELLLIY